MPEEITTDKNVIASEVKQSVDNPPIHSLPLDIAIAETALKNAITPENVIVPKNVIARSEATKQSVQAEQEAPLPPPAPASATQAVTALNDRLAALAAENAAAVEILSQRHADLIALQGSHDSAVTAYRNLLISTNPAVFSEDCLPGVTIQEIEASAKKVNDIAAKVRAQLQADIKAVIVPAGAPERSGPDTSTLSSIDKIKYAISQDKNH